MLDTHLLAVGMWSCAANEMTVYGYTYTAPPQAAIDAATGRPVVAVRMGRSSPTTRDGNIAGIAASASTEGTGLHVTLTRRVLFSHSSFSPLDSLCSVSLGNGLVVGTTDSQILVWNWKSDGSVFVSKATTEEILPPTAIGGDDATGGRQVVRCLAASHVPCDAQSTSNARGAVGAGAGTNADLDQLTVLMALERITVVNQCPGAIIGRANHLPPPPKGHTTDLCVTTVLTRRFMPPKSPRHRAEMVPLHFLYNNAEGPAANESKSAEGAADADYAAEGGGTRTMASSIKVQQNEITTVATPSYTCASASANLIFRGNASGLLCAWRLEGPNPLFKLDWRNERGSTTNKELVDGDTGSGDSAAVSAVCADAGAKKVAVAYADGRISIFGQRP